MTKMFCRKDDQRGIGSGEGEDHLWLQVAVCDSQGMAVDYRIYQAQENMLDEVVTTEVEVSLRDRGLIGSERPFGGRAGGRTNISPADASSMTMKSKPLSSNVR